MTGFFEVIRAHFGALSQNQVDGLNVLLDATAGLPVPHRAYVLATAWHETGPAGSAKHMTPRVEIWGPTKAQEGYEGRADLGNAIKGDGKRFLGRGYVQITGRRNYATASKVVGVDLVTGPDKALEPGIAARVIVDGMTRGWFTGRKMADYTNYVGMRRVVNGTDKANLIAGYAEAFEKALQAAQKAAPEAQQPAPVPTIVPAGDIPPAPPAATLQGTMAIIAGLIAAAVAAILAFFSK